MKIYHFDPVNQFCRESLKPIRKSCVAWMIGIGIVLVSSGCQAPMHLPSWMSGPGLNGPNAKLGNGLRGQDSDAPIGTGVDSRARDIEKNLGYR